MGKHTGYTSVDKPYLRTMPQLSYDPDVAKKSIYDMIRESPNYAPNKIALNFYGKKITNKEFYTVVLTSG